MPLYIPRYTHSITSDVFGAWGDPTRSLELIAEAGFKFVHWCHEWTGIAMYDDEEIYNIRRTLMRLGLQLLDTHATDGGTVSLFRWLSTYDFYRRQGLALILNRIQFTQKLGGRAIIFHAPTEPENPAEKETFWSILEGNLDQMYWWAAQYEIDVAWENTDTFPTNVPVLDKILSNPKHQSRFGLCLDSGHGGIHADNHQLLTRHSGRLKALHLNGSNPELPKGQQDIHRLPLHSSTIEWRRLMRQIGDSSYEGPLQCEVGMRDPRYQGMSKLDYLWECLKQMDELEDMRRAA